MQQDPQPRVLRSAHLIYDVPAAAHNRVIAAPDFPFPFDVPGVQVKMRPHAKPSDRARSVIELLSSDEEPAKNRVNRKANRDSETEDDQFEILDHRVNGIPKTIQEMPTFKRAPRLGRRIAGGSKPNGLVTAIRKRPAPVKDEPLPDIGPSRALQTVARDTVAADEAEVGISTGDDDEYKPGIKARPHRRGSHSQAESTRRRPGKYKPLFDAPDSDGEVVTPQPERKSARGRTTSRTSSQQGKAGFQRARGMQVDEAETTAKDVFEAGAFDDMVDMMEPLAIPEAFLEALLRDTEEGEGVQADDLKPAAPVMPVVAADPEPEEQVALPAIAELPEEPLPPTILGIDDIGYLVPLIISLIPDVCPDHLDEVIRGQIFADPGRRVSTEDACTEVVARLFDTDLATYPKAKDKKRKVEAEAGPSDPKRRKMGDDLGAGVQGRPDDGEAEYLTNGRFNYKSEKARTAERQGWGYRKCIAKDLQNIFPEMTTKHISNITTFHLGLYVPTYIDLAFQHALPDVDRPYKPMKTPRVVDFSKLLSASTKPKGKGKKATKADEDGTAVYQEEKEFLIEMLADKGDNASVEALKVLQPLEGDGDAECQCCFGDEHTAYMVQCREGHQFCRDCLKRLLETALGDQKAPAHCMDGSGCKALFSDHEMQKVLAPRMANSYLALIQRKELEAAGIENLETCPSCEFAIVIENEEEKLFTCQHPECEVVSCRACKKPDHIPRTCAEASADDKLDKRHTVEEAMTEALVRKCPKPSCQKPFLKEAGCNKITCDSCRTISCYVCRAIITNGYQHFDQQPGQSLSAKGKCRLWDPAGGVDPYQEEVANARAQAQQDVLAEAARLGQAIGQRDLDVPLPRDGENAPKTIAPDQLIAAARAAWLPGHVPQLINEAAAIRQDQWNWRAYRDRLDAYDVQDAVDMARDRANAADIPQPDRAADLQNQATQSTARLAALQAEAANTRIARDAISIEVERIRGLARLNDRFGFDQALLGETEARLARQQAQIEGLEERIVDATAVADFWGRRLRAAVPPPPGLLNPAEDVWAGGRVRADYPGLQRFGLFGE